MDDDQNYEIVNPWVKQRKVQDITFYEDKEEEDKKMLESISIMLSPVIDQEQTSFDFGTYLHDSNGH